MNCDKPDFKYALKSIFSAHSADVRVIEAACAPDGGLITGSRDNSVKVWSPAGKEFAESHVFTGAANYISSLCVLPPTEQYPTGLVLAGSHDCSIYGFTPHSSGPVFKLLGHSGPVCSLTHGKYGMIVSGSWDKTARVWSGQQCSLILNGHVQAVWATDMFPTQNLILTGSADHTIRLWRSGVCEKIFSGHEDCVRGLAIISETKFLSCSNDTTVRLWLISGECLEVFKSHSDYIYGITLLSDGMNFVTCGEDQNIKIWKSGVCAQTIVIAPKSLWSVACLSNGDLAIGTSDGKVYVFEKVSVDYFERASEFGVENNATMDTNNHDSTVPKEIHDNGISTYDGEAVIMYENENNFMYVCSYHATGSEVRKELFDLQVITKTFCLKPAAPVASGSSTIVKKYDYEFDVDVENTFYKLAYNRRDNPWDVARNFVAEHNLLSEHVSQIVEYIIRNTAASFTNECFPAKTYLTYLKINIAGLKTKLLEFCERVPKENYLSPPQVDDLIALANFPDEVSLEQMSSLDKVISWDDEIIFPVLDLLRLAVRCKGLKAKISSKDFVNLLLYIFAQTRKRVNRVLIMKIFCNMFGLEVDEVLVHYQDKIFNSVKDAFCSNDLSIQKAGAALLLNFSIASYNEFKINLYEFCFNITEILPFLVDSEAILRILVAIGTVCTHNPVAISCFRSLEIKELLKKFNESTGCPKIARVLALLNSDF